MKTFFEIVCFAAFIIVGSLAFECTNFDSNMGATFDLTDLSR
jgi:hypothetical protein